MSDRKRTGRPTKPATPGARASLGLKVTGEIKERLDAAARANGRTQSQEAEARLERSFQEQQLLPELLALSYGPRLAGLLQAIGRAMKTAGVHGGFMSCGDAAADWFDNPFGFAKAREAAEDVLRSFSLTVDAEALSNVPEGVVDSFGHEVAAGVLEALSNPERGGEIGEWATPVRKQLGDATERITGDFDAIVLPGIEPTAASPDVPASPSITTRLTRPRKSQRPDR